ncbi:MAG: AAA family ATPase, partial [Halobacteriales archaeon]|nr:AAA family ATPase [Halobacteriales archaeon]
ALETVGLTDAADRAVDGYSNGMRRRLGLAAALLPRPRILLLDEPTAGLDPRGVATFHRVIRDLQAETGLTVVLASHVLSEVERLCDHVAIIHDGTLRMTGRIADLKDRLETGPQVIARFTTPAAAEQARPVVEKHGGQPLTTDGSVLTILAPRDRLPDLLKTLESETSLAGYEVREPGLEAVFEAAINAGGDSE